MGPGGRLPARSGPERNEAPVRPAFAGGNEARYTHHPAWFVRGWILILLSVYYIGDSFTDKLEPIGIELLEHQRVFPCLQQIAMGKFIRTEASVDVIIVPQCQNHEDISVKTL